MRPISQIPRSRVTRIGRTTANSTTALAERRRVGGTRIMILVLARVKAYPDRRVGREVERTNIEHNFRMRRICQEFGCSNLRAQSPRPLLVRLRQRFSPQ